MYRKYLVKRTIYGLLMYVVMIFTYSALFNKVAEETVLAQIEEQVAQEAIKHRNVTPEKMQQIIADARAMRIHQYHLDQSYVFRVFWRAFDTLTFNFGRSALMKAPNGDREVIAIIGDALPRTIVLFSTEVALVTVLGVVLGLYAARKPNGPLDKSISMTTMITNGLPAWWLGMLMIMFFSYAVPIFPSGGLQSNPPPQGIAAVFDFLWHLALPLITLVFLNIWGTAYLIRNIVLSNLQEDYVMAARARGIPERRVLFGHTLRTSLPAIMTLAILGLFSSIAGNIIVEGIFGWPGIGNLYFIAVQQNDVPVLMGTLAIETFINMLGFVLLDLIYGLLDPRIKAGGHGMNLKDSLSGLREFWREYRKVGSGLVGLAILAVFIVLAFVGPGVVPFAGATSHWHDITYWKDNPRAAPPAWVNWFSARKGAVSALLMPSDPITQFVEGRRRLGYAFTYDYEADKAPRDLIFRFLGEGQVSLKLDVARPDGSGTEIYQGQVELGADYQRISVDHDALGGILELVSSVDEFIGSSLDPGSARPLALLFSEIDADMADSPRALKGKYSFDLSIELLSKGARVDMPELLVSGEVSGILGTDVSKRDIFTGVVVGIKWALIIGFLTSIVTVIVGVTLGVVAAYFGGVSDWLLTRLYEFIYLLPVLPFLIVLSAIYKPSIYVFMVIICLLFWSGPYKPVYSMALQIKEETFVEASKALGSSRSRIIFKHIIPILLPYSFAVMALSIPGVIVYEASVSLLGLGDSSIVTWGQILQAALSQGAVINNLWWWVIPPGLMIALMGMSFAFIGSAMDKILHPKLKIR